MKYVFLLSFLFFSFFINVTQVSAQEKPSFRILAPKILCDTGKNKTDIPPPSQITVRMQTEGGQRLTYVVRIYFEILGGWKSQQHSISIWRSVRLLEKKITTHKEEISVKNQIDIYNKELTPGVRYVFTIVGVGTNGVESNSQNFSVTYKSSKETEINQLGSSSNAAGDVSFLLIAAIIGYGNIPFFVEAKLIFCTPTTDYFFKWEMTNLPTNAEKWTNIPGKTLWIPPGILKSGENYDISAKIMNTTDSSIITEAIMKLNILPRGFYANMIPRNLSIGVNRGIVYRVSFSNQDNSGSVLDIKWECQNLLSSENCIEFIPSTDLIQVVTFYTKGQYVVKATLTLNSAIQMLSSTVTVDPKVIASVDFSAGIPPRPAVAGEEFLLMASIHNLIPNCFAEWMTVKEEGYSYFEPDSAPFDLGKIEVYNVEENFLSELIEYGNDTISQDLLLMVPGKTSDWGGLEPESSYKFRLTITCPEPIDDNFERDRQNITSYSDFIITTNQPPVGQPLDITPMEGLALKTVFKFSTGVASDLPDDYPMRYLFKYKVDNYMVDIEEYYENMVTTIELPYSESPIKTYYRVCDSRNACSEIQGPEVFVNLTENVSRVEFDYKLNEIKNSMKRMEYEKVFASSLAYVLTFKHFSKKNYYNEMSSLLIKNIESEVQRLQKAPEDQKYFISRTKLVTFVKLSKKLIDLLDVDDFVLGEKLLNLLNSLSEEKADIRDAEEENSLIRKRSISLAEDTNDSSDCNMIDDDLIKTRLDFATLNSKTFSSNLNLLTQKKREFTEMVHELMKMSCKSLEFSQLCYIASTNVVFEVVKSSLKQIQSKNDTIPSLKYKKHAYVLLGNLYKDAPIEGEFCIGKAIYPSDYMTGSVKDVEPMYDIIVMKFDKQSSNLSQVDILPPEVEKTAIFSIPVQEGNEENYENLQCALWDGTKWSDKYCDGLKSYPQVIQCKCDASGFLRLISIDYESTVREVNSSDIQSPTVVSVKSEEIVSESTNGEVIQPEETPKILQQTTSKFGEENTTVIIDKLPMEISTPAPSSSSSPPDMPSMLPMSTIFPPTNIVEMENENKIDNSSVTEVNVTAKSNIITSRSSSESNVLGYVLISILILIILLAIVINLYYLRWRRNRPFSQEAEAMATEMRVQSPDVRYARFYDEQTMNGDLIDNIT